LLFVELRVEFTVSQLLALNVVIDGIIQLVFSQHILLFNFSVNVSNLVISVLIFQDLVKVLFKMRLVLQDLLVIGGVL